MVRRPAGSTTAPASKSNGVTAKESLQSTETMVIDGDVTDDLFSSKDAVGKRSLCESLNKDAKKKQEAHLQDQLCKAAAEILRTRVVVLENTAAAKAYMESCTTEGLRTRVVYVDFTQFASLQSKGAWSKILRKQPSKVACDYRVRRCRPGHRNPAIVMRTGFRCRLGSQVSPPSKSMQSCLQSQFVIEEPPLTKSTRVETPN